MIANKLTVACPNCSTSVEWSSTNKFRPFCSKRCKMIDLGEWASEGYKIAGQKTTEQHEGNEEDDNSRH